MYLETQGNPWTFNLSAEKEEKLVTIPHFDVQQANTKVGWSSMTAPQTLDCEAATADSPAL